MWFIPFSLRIKFLIWGNSENETKQNSVSMQPICNEYSFMRRRIVKWAMKSVHTLEYVRKLSAKTNTNMIICADRCSRRFYLLEILWKWPIKSWAILCIWMKKKYPITWNEVTKGVIREHAEGKSIDLIKFLLM